MFIKQKTLFFAIFIFGMACQLFAMDQQQQPRITPQQAAARQQQRRRIQPVIQMESGHTSVTSQVLNPTAPAQPACSQTETSAPPAKRAKVSQNAIQLRNPVDEVFKNSHLLSNIFDRLKLPDFYRLACVSKACYEASKTCREKLHADTLAEQVNTPIRHVLDKSQGAMTFLNTTCNTKNLVRLLHQKGSLNDEALIDPEALEYLEWLPDYQKALFAWPCIGEMFSDEEQEVLKTIQTLEFDFQAGDSEDLLIDKLRTLEKIPQHKNCLYAIKIVNEDGDMGQITRSLINKLAQFPIVALTCCNEQFPEGLACIAPLTKLRWLAIEDCDLQGQTALPDELCESLPLLTGLRLLENGIISLPTSIGKLKHLRVMVLNEELNNLPQELHNLDKLIVFYLHHHGSLPAEAIPCLPQLEGIKDLCLPDMGPASNPIPESSNMEMLQVLELWGTIEPLRQHPEKFKNLKKLTLNTVDTPLELSPCIANLPALTTLILELSDGTIIPYETLLAIVRNVPDYIFDVFFTIEGDPQKVADTWQLFQINRSYILAELTPHEDYYRKFYSAEIDTIHQFAASAISFGDLKKLAGNNCAAATNCENFMRMLLKKYRLNNGITESKRIINEFKRKGQEFARRLPIIAKELSEDVTSVCNKLMDGTSLDISWAEIKQQPHSFYNILRRLAATINEILNNIEQGKVITADQFRHCMKQLKLCTRTLNCVKSCATQIVALFVDHANRFQSTTNQRILIKYCSNIDNFI